MQTEDAGTSVLEVVDGSEVIDQVTTEPPAAAGEAAIDQGYDTAEAEIRRGLRLLFRKGDMVEIRVAHWTGEGLDEIRGMRVRRMPYGMPLAYEALLADIEPGPYSIYCVVNPTTLTATEDWVREGTKESEIARRGSIYWDVETRSHLSPPDEAEIAAARQVADSLRAWLTEQGVSSWLCSSGGYCHVGLRLEPEALGCDLESDDLIRELLARGSERFSTDKVKIDVLADRNRLTKLYGSLHRKGVERPAEGRVWRRSRVIEDSTASVGRAEIERLLVALPPCSKPLPKAVASSEKAVTGSGPWTTKSLGGCLEAWQDEHQEFNYQARRVGRADNGQGFAVVCPGEVSGELAADDREWPVGHHETPNPRLPSEGGHDAVAWIQDGWPAFSCGHPRCSETGKMTFRDLQEFWDPDGDLYDYTGEALIEERCDVVEWKEPEPAAPAAVEVSEARASGAAPARTLDSIAAETFSYNLTDTGNAKRLRRLSKGHHLYSPERGWSIWEDGVWRKVKDGAATRAAMRVAPLIVEEVKILKVLEGGDETIKDALKWGKTSESAARIKAALELFAALPGVTRPLADFDEDGWLLNLQNGTLDLRTGELREHRLEDYLTRKAPVVYDPSSKCERWQEFIREISDGRADMPGYLQRWLGYCLTPDNREQCMAVLWGDGSNGKSTLLRAVHSLLGRGDSGYSMVAQSKLLAPGRWGDDNIPNELAGLCGARLVTASEGESSSRLNASIVKQITGGDEVTARFLHKEFFSYTPTCKLWLATNHKPVINDTDAGIWRRMRLIPFTASWPEGDPRRDETLAAKLKAELPGILNWALVGLAAWRESGLQTPAFVREATDEYRREEDRVGTWVSEKMRRLDVWHPASTLYSRYHDWAKERGEEPLGMKRWGTEMQRLGIPRRRARVGTEYRLSEASQALVSSEGLDEV
ncbi:MAG: DNA primase family protein [Terriglobales bacterium]